MFGAQRRSAFEQRTGKPGDRKPSFEVSVRIQIVLLIYSVLIHKGGAFKSRNDQMRASEITCVGKRRAWLNGMLSCYCIVTMLSSS